MSDSMEYREWEKWYPLTYSGYYTAELARVSSFRHECCRLDLSRFRGQIIGLKAVSEEPESICTLTDPEGRSWSNRKMRRKAFSYPQMPFTFI